MSNPEGFSVVENEIQCQRCHSFLETEKWIVLILFFAVLAFWGGNRWGHRAADRWWADYPTFSLKAPEPPYIPIVELDPDAMYIASPTNWTIRCMSIYPEERIVEPNYGGDCQYPRAKTKGIPLSEPHAHVERITKGPWEGKVTWWASHDFAPPKPPRN